MTPTVLSVGSRVLLAACQRLGMNSDQLIAAARIDRDALSDPDGRLPAEAAYELWMLAYEASGDPHLALKVAKAVPSGSYRALEYLIASAPTVGAAFGKISQYFSWIDPSAGLPITAHGDHFTFGLDIAAPASQLPLSAAEYTFGTSWLKVRELTGQTVSPLRVEVGAPAPPTRDVVEEFFGCPVDFQASHNRMHFSKEAWQSVSLNADPTLLAVLDAHAKALLDAVESPSELIHNVRGLLEQSQATLSLSEVARKLGMSERTLQRRLTDEGQPFVNLVAAARQDLAQRLLAERTVAIAEVAFILGFSDQSSFTRAFRRWTGQTPAAYRGR